jgi:hypothetical protein
MQSGQNWLNLYFPGHFTVTKIDLVFLQMMFLQKYPILIPHNGSHATEATTAKRMDLMKSLLLMISGRQDKVCKVKCIPPV